jgi:hypothetical protein
VNKSSTVLGVAFSCLAKAGRIGSTKAIPMKETTHANATAHTPRGWRNGLTVALWSLLTGPPYRRSGGRASGPISLLLFELVEVLDRRGRRDERFGFVDRQLVDQPREPISGCSASGLEVVRPAGGERDESDALVSRVCASLNQAQPFELAHEHCHRRLGHAFDHREVGDTARPGQVQCVQRRHRRQAQVSRPAIRRRGEPVEGFTDGRPTLGACGPRLVRVLRSHTNNIALTIY